MITPETFARRREALADLLQTGLVLLRGHPRLPMNLPMNLTPARQSSHILYLTGLKETDCAVLFHVDSRRLEVFLPAHDPDDAVWHGPTPSRETLRAVLGADAIHDLDRLEARIAHYRSTEGVPIHTLPSADPWWRRRMAAVGIDVPEFGGLDPHVPNPLADALVQLRLKQDEAGLNEMREAAAISARAFDACMRATRPGRREATIRALFEAGLRAEGVRPAYDPIVTVHGEILHCGANPNTLEEGRLLLVDAGAESPEGYASDVTRTWPVGGRFTSAQRDVYQIVLDAQRAAVEDVEAGAEFKNLHLNACRRMADGLRTLGILRGSLDEIIDRDAHALFFPHGLGHLIGLDVHDLEDLGDRAGYAPGRRRSKRFGLAWLRLDRPLEPGMVITIEPGIYFIPALLESPERREEYKSVVNFERACNFLGFGGIRIEDDVLVTDGKADVLTASIPKDIDALEEIVGEAGEAGVFGRTYAD